jgi:hypothetical protein
MNAKAIIKDLLSQRGISEAEFFGDSLHANVTNARRAVILALNEAGLDNRAIADAVKRDMTTVRYWLNPASRERRIKYKAGGRTRNDARWQWAVERGVVSA